MSGVNGDGPLYPNNKHPTAFTDAFQSNNVTKCPKCFRSSSYIIFTMYSIALSYTSQFGLQIRSLCMQPAFLSDVQLVSVIHSVVIVLGGVNVPVHRVAKWHINTSRWKDLIHRLYNCVEFPALWKLDGESWIHVSRMVTSFIFNFVSPSITTHFKVYTCWDFMV